MTEDFDDDNDKAAKAPSCRNHKSARLQWRDYDRLSTAAKRAFQHANVDWCVRCFTRDTPDFMIPLAVANADAAELERWT